MATTTKAHRTSADLDRLRARALQGDSLKELPDADQEWVWRSVLKGVRRPEAVRLAGLSADQVERALVKIRQRYDQRIVAYKRRQAQAAMQPKVVRPIAPAPPAAPRRGIWPFGRH